MSVSLETNDEVELEVCEGCECPIPEGEEHLLSFGSVKHKFYCDDCVFECEWCERLYPNVVRFSTENYAMVCEDCRDNNFTECDDCGGVYCNDNVHYIDSCDSSVCEGCINDNYFTCERCDEMRHNDEHGSDGRCSNCYSEAWYGSDRNPTYKYHPTNQRGEIYLGVELEIDCGCDPESVVHDMKKIGDKFFWYKNDASLDEAGIEIVSHPATLDYHQSEAKWDEVIKIARKNGYKSHATDTCGLHIHVDRRALSKVEQVRLGIFVYGNWNKMKRFSRRNNNGYARPKSKEQHEIDMKEGPNYSVRYEAINYSNRRTIEFRLFRGSMKYNTLIATIEFVDALCRFIKTASTQEVAIESWGAFVGFVMRRKRYKHLKVYLEERRLIDA